MPAAAKIAELPLPLPPAVKSRSPASTAIVPVFVSGNEIVPVPEPVGVLKDAGVVESERC